MNSNPVRFTSQQIGLWGESIAAAFLRKKGYRVVAQRAHSGHHGEIDLIMQNDQILVFVEVKTRHGSAYAPPIAAMNRRKKQALTHAALAYLQRLRNRPPYFRFDVIEVIGQIDSPIAPIIKHHEHAIRIEGRYHPQW